MTSRLRSTLALAIAVLGGCHAGAHAAITVRVGGAASWTIPDKSAADPKSRADRAVIEAFEKIHPDIDLVNSNGLQIAGPAAESNLLLQFAGGTAPDVVYVNFRSMENYIQQGFLMPLDGYLAEDPALLARINPAIRRVISVDGKIYALPYAQFVQALYYRKDLFQEAGLDPDSPPKTWDEFYGDSRALTNPKTGVWAFEWPNSAEGTAYWWCNLLWQAGGDVIRRNASGQWTASFDSPQGVQALDFYKKLTTLTYIVDGMQTTATEPNAPNFASDRARGKVAMWFAYQSNVIANVADATTVNPSLVGIAPIPAGPAGSANEINAAMWGISSQIKNPRVRAAAWEFIKFMGSDDADRIRTASYVEAGLGNLINPVSLRKYGYADEAGSVSKEWLKTNVELFSHGHPEPYAANMQAVYNLVGQPLQAIVLNPSADPRTLLALAAEQVDNTLIGYTPPKVLARRRAIALSVFVALVAGLVAGAVVQIRRVLGSARENPEPTGESGPAGGRRRTAMLAWTFMLPAILSVLVWSYYPLARGLVMAFQDYKIIQGAHFVGLDNFIDVFYVGDRLAGPPQCGAVHGLQHRDRILSPDLPGVAARGAAARDRHLPDALLPSRRDERPGDHLLVEVVRGPHADRAVQYTAGCGSPKPGQLAGRSENGAAVGGSSRRMGGSGAGLDHLPGRAEVDSERPVRSGGPRRRGGVDQAVQDHASHPEAP